MPSWAGFACGKNSEAHNSVVLLITRSRAIGNRNYHHLARELGRYEIAKQESLSERYFTEVTTTFCGWPGMIWTGCATAAGEKMGLPLPSTAVVRT